MKTIDLGGITYIRPVAGCGSGWYCGMSYDHGDPYEAEEIYRAGGTVKGRDLYLISYPDGEVYAPVLRREGCYAGEPVYHDGRIYLYNIDFIKAETEIMSFDCASGETATVAVVPMDGVEDCYNLSLNTWPLTLSRHVVGEVLEILWPERLRIELEGTESFYHRDGDRLYFGRWFEDPDYREDTVVRNLDGKVVGELGGSVFSMPDGQLWLVK